MSIEKTSGIIHDLVTRIAGNQNLTRSAEAKKAASGISGEAHAPVGGDKVEISAEAKEIQVEATEIQKKISSLKAEINKIPDVRAEKIMEAKARIKDGIYDRNAVVKEVARSIKESGLL